MDLVQIVEQLSPANRQLAEQLIAQLAERDGINVNHHELADPIHSVPLWIAWLKTLGRSPRTIEMYGADVKRYLEFNPRPTDLSIEAYMAKRLEQVTAARVSSEQKALKSLFGYLHERGLWNTNPCARMKLVREARKEIECPTNDEIMALISYHTRRAKDDAKFKVMLMLLINTGLRMEEACSARRNHIDLQALEIKVLGKGNKERIVPISPFIAGLLQLYMQDNPTTTPYLFPANTKAGYWFHTGFYGALKLACKRLGIRILHPHQLRHFFATKTLEHGAKLEVISKILGHSSVAITADVYRHIQLKEFHSEHEQHDPLTQLPLQKLLAKGGDIQVVNGEIISEEG